LLVLLKDLYKVHQNKIEASHEKYRILETKYLDLKKNLANLLDQTPTLPRATEGAQPLKLR